MRATLIVLTLGVAAVATPAVAVSTGPPLWAGPAAGIVPPHGRDIAAARTTSASFRQLSYHREGRVLTGVTPVTPVTWGAVPTGTIAGMQALYAGIGVQNYVPNTPTYIATNGEYTQTIGGTTTPVGLAVTASAARVSTAAVPAGAPSTSQVLAAVVTAVGAGNLVDDAYYPVYSSIRRGTAGYCAWHSWGTVTRPNGTTARVTFGFFFDLAGDAGCDPKSTIATSSQAVAALANVTGHELSEVLTDPYLSAWYDAQGAENADKCAWNFGSPVSIGGVEWKIQKNWSNAAAGCVQVR